MPQKEESKRTHAKAGVGTQRSKPDLSTTYDYLRNSSCSLHQPRGTLNRTTEVRYFDDATRCLNETIKMLFESEKEVPCPAIARRYMRHLMEYHHRDAEGQANIQPEHVEQKPPKKSCDLSFIDFDGDPVCTTSSPFHRQHKRAYFKPTCSFVPSCYLPCTNENDEPIFPDKSIGKIVRDWMKSIPINANFTPTDKILRNRFMVELTKDLSNLITEPNYEALARTVIINYLSHLPMWLPEGQAQVEFKDQMVDLLLSRLTEVRFIIGKLKSEIFKWLKNVDYEPRYDNGEIVTDYKIANSMAQRLKPLILNRPANENIHKNKLQSEIFDALLYIPLDVRDELKCKVINNLANDLANRLVCLNGDSEKSVEKKSSESEGSLIRHSLNDWMRNIPVNPCFSQIDLELREKNTDDLANELTKIRRDHDFKLLGKDAIMKFLYNLPMWWPNDDDKVVFMNELAEKLIDKLAGLHFSEEIKNIVSQWAGNINPDDDDIIFRVLNNILPIISIRHQLGEEDYKTKLKRSICEELRNTLVDSRGENQSMVIDTFSRNLIDKLIELDKMKSFLGWQQMDSKTSNDSIHNIIKNWMKTLPVNHDFSLKEKQIRDQKAEDLANELTLLINDTNFESKLKDATLRFLRNIPLWTPDDNEEDKFMIDKSNKLSDKIVRFFKTEDQLKHVYSSEVHPVVMNSPNDDDKYRHKCKIPFIEEVKKYPTLVKHENEKHIKRELVEDIANNLDTTKPKTRTNVLINTVSKWLNDIPVQSDFKLKDDDLRKELTGQLIDKLIKLTENHKTLAEIPTEVKAKTAVLECLKDLPMWRPEPEKQDEYNNELIAKLFQSVKDSKCLPLLFREREFTTCNGNKRESTSNADEKNSVTTRSKLKSYASDSIRISKSEKRRRSKINDIVRKNSNKIGNIRQKSGASKTESRLSVKSESSSEELHSDESGSSSSKPDNIKNEIISLPYVPSSKLSIQKDDKKRDFDILKDNSTFTHFSPIEKTHVLKKITNKNKPLPRSHLIEMKSFIDKAVSEWIDVLEKKAMEKQLRQGIVKCLKTTPEISKVLINKSNESLVYQLASKITNYETKGSDKLEEEKIEDEVRNVVQKIFENENIDIEHESVENISQAILKVMHQVETNKNDMKQTFQTEIIQWMISIPEISNISNKKEYKRIIKKIVYDLQMLAATKTTDNVLMNRIHEQISLFLESLLQKENVVMVPSIKKQHITKLLNHLILLIKLNKNPANRISTLRSEISYWMVEKPLHKNGNDRDIEFILNLLRDHRRIRVTNRENFVKNLVLYFITEILEKSCDSISVEMRSILKSELLEKLDSETENEKNIKVPKDDATLSNEMKTRDTLIEEIINNHMGWTKITEDDETFRRDNKFAEIMKNYFFNTYGSRKAEIQDIPEYFQSSTQKQGSQVDPSIVYDLTSELMTDVNINIKRSNKIKLNNDNKLCNLFDSSKEKSNDYNTSRPRKTWDNNSLTYTEVLSKNKETLCENRENNSNEGFFKGKYSEMNQINITTPSPLKTYVNDISENKSTEKRQENLKITINPCRSQAIQLCNEGIQSTSKDFSNKPVISCRYKVNENGKGSEDGNLKGSHPSSSSQSSEDLTYNIYSLRNNISKNLNRFLRKSPYRKIPSSSDSTDDSSIDEKNILSIIKRRLYRSSINEPDVFTKVPCINCQGHREATKRSRGSNTDDKPVSVSTIIDNLFKNLYSTKSVAIRKGIAEILVQCVGLKYKEADRYADLLIEKTKNIYRNIDETENKSTEISFLNILKIKIENVFKELGIQHISEEAEQLILNLLTNQVVGTDLNDNLTMSLMKILADVNKNLAEKVEDSLLDNVKRLSITDPMISDKRKPLPQNKRYSRQQYLTALSLENRSSLKSVNKLFTSKDKEKYLEIKNDIVDFIKERNSSLTPSETGVIHTATDNLFRIYMNTKENSETSINDLESVVRREIENFLLIVPIETNESEDDLVDEIAKKLRDVDFIKKRFPGVTTTIDLSSHSSYLTQQQQEAFLKETKKMLNDICEDNDIDIFQAKHSTLELYDKLKEMISNKELSDTEKMQLMNKEFFQFFRNLPSKSRIIPGDFAKQVVDKIPSKLPKTKTLATSSSSQKDLNRNIIEFIRAKTGDMTSHSLQKLQDQIEDVIAVIRSTIENGSITPNRKSDIIKCSIARIISEIPCQSSKTAEHLASGLYDIIFRPPRSLVITPSPSYSSSNEDIMIIKDNETSYLKQLMNIIRNWTDQVPMIRDEIEDPDLKDYMARDLAIDITDRQKYIQFNNSAKTSYADELEYLKYQVFRWLNRTLDVNDLSPFISNIKDLMEQIREVPIYSLVKPSNKILKDKNIKRVGKIPHNNFTPKGHIKQIKELSDKIQHQGEKSHSNLKADRLSQFIPNILKDDDPTLQVLKKQRCKNQGLLKNYNAGAHKTGLEDLYKLIEDWCSDLPIYLGDLPEEKEIVETIKKNINSKLINKIDEINMNPQILNDDFLYEDLLLDEMNKVLIEVPRNPDLEKYLLALKKDVISRLKGARKKIRDEQAYPTYKQQLRDTIATSALIPEPLYPDEMTSFEILRDNLVDAFINLHYNTYNNEHEIQFKRKVSDKISKFCNDYLRRHPCTPIDPNKLSRQLYRALQAIPIPKEESMLSEIEELKIKEILYEWVKELPLKEETGSELILRNKTITVLAKRLREIEKESKIHFNREEIIRKEIMKWFKRNPLKVGHESEVLKAIDRIVEKLKKPGNMLNMSKALTDDCYCLPDKLVIPPSTLSPEDQAHLRMIRNKYDSPCLSVNPNFTLENSSQTIGPRNWCPNLKTQDRLPMCSSKQSPFPCPPMMSSVNPFEMHQYPHVIVKDNIWDSMDSKILSTKTPRVPCQAKSPSCMQKQMSTQQPLSSCNSVSSQICPAYDPLFSKSSDCKCSQTTQANVDIPCSTPKSNRIPDSQDSDDEEDFSEGCHISACKTIIDSRVCKSCRPTGALYSSFLPRKSKKKTKKAYK